MSKKHQEYIYIYIYYQNYLGTVWAHMRGEYVPCDTLPNAYLLSMTVSLSSLELEDLLFPFSIKLHKYAGNAIVICSMDCTW